VTGVVRGSVGMAARAIVTGTATGAAIQKAQKRGGNRTPTPVAGTTATRARQMQRDQLQERHQYPQRTRTAHRQMIRDEADSRPLTAINDPVRVVFGSQRPNGRGRHWPSERTSSGRLFKSEKCQQLPEPVGTSHRSRTIVVGLFGAPVPHSEQRQKYNTAGHEKCANCPDNSEALLHEKNAN
jgi:hypothetical protein